MKNCNKVFFGESGITATSANYLCNLAKEVIAEDEEELNSASFIEKTVQIIGSQNGPMTASEGKEEDWVTKVPERIHRIMNMHSLIAWLREAIKAKEDEEVYWKNYLFPTWLKEVKQISPKELEVSIPKYPSSNDVLGELNVAERYKYLAAEACASTIGKFVHPDGAINKARRTMVKRLANPVETSGEGVNLVITNYKASIHTDVVDKLFTQLQNEQRSYEKYVNSVKAQVTEEANRLYKNVNDESIRASKEAIAKESNYRKEYDNFINERLEEVSKLKIVIPNALKETVAYLNSLGQPEESK